MKPLRVENKRGKGGQDLEVVKGDKFTHAN